MRHKFLAQNMYVNFKFRRSIEIKAKRSLETIDKDRVKRERNVTSRVVKSRSNH